MKTPAPPRLRRPRSGWNGTMWLLVLCLVFKSGVPMLAAAAAQLRGVGVAEVCTVYGVALPSVPDRPAVAGIASMAAMHAGMGAEPHGAHDASATRGSGTQSHPAHSSHEHHGDLASGHDHCVLTPLLGAAALSIGAATVDIPSACEAPGHRPSVAAAPLHDAALAWYARDAHPPPA